MTDLLAGHEIGSRNPGDRALILLSGGLDSAVAALAARSLGYQLNGLSFLYGQRHRIELEYAAGLARDLHFAGHHVVELAKFPSRASALTDAQMEVPKRRTEAEMMSASIPSTYVPARNTLFLSYALAWCECLEIGNIFIGVNALDYSGYPDCRPEYLQAFQRLADLATRAGVGGGPGIRLRAPLLHRSKRDIILLGRELGLDFKATWSCYDPAVSAGGPLPCGACDSCLLRKKGFLEAGVPDPTPYAVHFGCA